MRVLLVVDMQNDFIDGVLGTKEAVAIVPRLAEKIRHFDGICIATYDTHHENYLETQEGRNLPVPHCIEGSEGWQLNRQVADALQARAQCSDEEAKTFKKPGFGSAELAEYLRALDRDTPIEEIVLVGVCTDICVISNAMLLKAFLPEVKLTVDAACCAGITKESHENALSAMQMCQISIENRDA